MAKAGVITIDINAGTAKFVQDLEQVKGGIRSVGKEVQTLGGAAQGTGFNIRYAFFGLKDIAEGRTRFAMAELANEMVRLRGAALGIGVAVVVVAAVAYAFTELGNKIKEANDKAAEAFRHLTEPMQQTNDELDVTNAKLTNDIALLEHKPVNRLAETLAEARVEADKLGEAIEGALEKLGKVLEEEGTGRFSAWLSGKTSTADIKDLNTNLKRQIREMDIKREGELARAVTGDEKDAINKKFDEAQFHKLEAFKKMADDAEARNIKSLPLVAAPDAADNIRRGAGLFKDVLDIQEARVSKTRDTDALKEKKQALEDQKKSATDQLKVWEDELTRKELINGKSVAQEQHYWSTALAIAKAFGPAYAGVVDSIDQKLLAGKTRGAEQAGQALKQMEAYEHSTAEKGMTAVQKIYAKRDDLLSKIGPGYSGRATDAANKEASSYLDTEATKENKRTEQFFGRPTEAADVGGHIAGEGENQLKKNLQVQNADLDEVMKERADGVYKNMKAVVEQAKKANEEAYKINNVDAQRGVEAGIEANTMKKLQTEAQYRANRLHSYQEETAYLQQISALDTNDLKLKLQAAESELKNAETLRASANALADKEAAQKDVEEKSLAVEKARGAVKKQELETAVQQAALDSQHSATLKQGLDSFIHDANAQMKQPGDILKDGLNSALDQTSDNLTKLMTGQKTKWADEFKSIGRSMLRESIKSELTEGLNALGIKTGKPDGTKNDPIYTVDASTGKQVQNGQLIPGMIGVTQGGSTSTPGGTFGSGSQPQSPFIFSALKNGFGQGSGMLAALKGIFTGSAGAGGGDMGVQGGMDFLSNLEGLAGGGDVDPGRAYMVGEQGPEPFIPRTAGSIIPNSRLGGGGGDTYHYTIDNRGAELGSENRLLAVLQSVHASAVSSAVKATNEQSRRMPRNRRA